MQHGAVLVEDPPFQKLEGHLVYGLRVSYPVWEQSLHLRFSEWEKLHEKATRGTPHHPSQLPLNGASLFVQLWTPKIE